MPDDLLFKILESLLTIWVPAVLSGSVLLWIHYGRVKQELRIKAKSEQFERRRSVYAKVLTTVDHFYDHLTMVTDDVPNWRITRSMHDELELVGSKEVITAFRKVYERLAAKANPEDVSKAIKDLRNAIRQDLFEEKPLKHVEMTFIEPGQKTMEALKIFSQNEVKLFENGVRSLKDMAQMDTVKVGKQTGIEPLIPADNVRHRRTQAKY
jgi:hypothetical protein